MLPLAKPRNIDLRDYGHRCHALIALVLLSYLRGWHEVFYFQYRLFHIVLANNEIAGGKLGTVSSRAKCSFATLGLHREHIRS